MARRDIPGCDAAGTPATQVRRDLASSTPGVAAVVALAILYSGCNKMNPDKLRWTVDTRAPLNARFVIAGDTVVVPTLGNDRSDRLSGLALADGRARWQVALDDFVLADASSGVQIAVDPDGTAVYLAQHSMVAAFAVADGRKRWAVQVPPSEPFEDFSIPQRPRVVGDRVYLVSRRARLVALDRRDGALIFRTADHDSASDVAIHAGVAITRSLEGADVRAFDDTGTMQWQRALTGVPGTTRLATSSALAAARAGDYLVIDGERALMSLDPATGAVRWEEPVVGLASFAFAGDTLIVTDAASVRALAPGTGVITWRHPTGGASLVAPLDATTVLLQLATRTCTVDVATGALHDLAHHHLIEQDQVLDAAPGSAVLTTDGGVARWFRRDGGAVHEATVGATTPEPGQPAAHAVLQAAITAAGVVTRDTAHRVSLIAP